MPNVIQHFEGVRDYGLSDEDKLLLSGDPEAIKAKSNLIRRLDEHGLSYERYVQMLVDQDSACAVCGSFKELVIDHDHKCCPARKGCGKCVRGLICHRCNRLLGTLESEDGLAENALAYLLR